MRIVLERLFDRGTGKEFMRQTGHGASVTVRLTSKRRRGHIGMIDGTVLCGQQARILARFSPTYFKLRYPCRNCERILNLHQTTKRDK